MPELYDETWNPIVGCSPVSAGCDNCGAVPVAHRLAKNPRIPEEPYDFVTEDPIDHNFHASGGVNGGHGNPYEELTTLTNGTPNWSGSLSFIPSRLEKPLRWRKPRRISVCSMGDLFHESVPFGWLDKVFETIRRTPHHSYQCLTKRPARMAQYAARAAPTHVLCTPTERWGRACER
jgi:protein gp37